MDTHNDQINHLCANCCYQHLLYGNGLNKCLPIWHPISSIDFAKSFLVLRKIDADISTVFRILIANLMLIFSHCYRILLKR